ncbi:MAG: hypothetical protein ACRD44_10865 [Bryobacteraceae bacterium]
MSWRPRAVLLAVALAATCAGADLFLEDFSRYPPGLLSQPMGQLNGAIQEYHGQEFALLSANIQEGGMTDGHHRRVVMFPDDGYPDLAYHVADVAGDSRDEIIVWDQRRLWIYTQDRPAIPGAP